MECPEEDTVLGFIEGRLASDRRAAFEEHVSGCGDCMELVAAAARLGATASEAANPAAGAGGPQEKVHLPSVAGQVLDAGASVGRYVVLQLVGRGGMGEVYAAYDPQLDRKVAIKLMRETAAQQLQQPVSRKRLLREAKAIARLSHPNVVAVFDAGTIDGQVFLAMEFVEGTTLAEWMKALPRQAAANRRNGRRSMERWQSILEVFLAAGRGLAAAHAARIVHRDFKPHNVMVGAHGEVRVMDFGLAGEPLETRDAAAGAEHDGGTGHAPDAPGSGDDAAGRPAFTQAMTVGLTRTGALLGTPAYMAPEQFQGGRVDARSDQFSFCVSLYEALYGERPFAGNTLMELIDGVVAGRLRPIPPNLAVPSWVRKVLLRGLRADPAQRYPSMNDLLVALSADPVRRQRRLVTLGVSAVLFASVAVAAGLVADRAHTRAQVSCGGAAARLAEAWEVPGGGSVTPGPDSRREKGHRAFLATGQAFAADTWTRVAAILDDYAGRWAAGYTEACQATHVRGEQSIESLDLRMNCLDEQLRALKTLTDLFATADTSLVAGATDAARALPDIRRCSELKSLRAGVPAPKDPATGGKAETLRRELGDLKVLKEAGRARDALVRAQAVVVSARLLDYPPIVAESLDVTSGLQIRVGEFGDAEVSAKEALWTALAARMDEEALRAAQTLHEVVGFNLVRFTDANVWSEMTESLLRRGGPGHDLQWAWLWNDRGIILLKRGLFAEARQHLEKARALKIKVLGPDDPDVAATTESIAALLLETGDYREAQKVSEGVIDVLSRIYGSSHPKVGHALFNAAEAQLGLGQFETALAMYRRSLSLWEPEIGPDSPILAYPLTGLGLSLLGLQDVNGAVDTLQRALALREAREVDPAVIAETRFALARALWQKGELARASALAQQARKAYAADTGLGRRLAEVNKWLTSHALDRAAPAEHAPVH